MRKLLLTRGLAALIDEEDFVQFGHLKWYASESRHGRFYAARKPPGGIVYLHRLILHPPVGLEVDHINGDSLDCRR